MLSIARYTVRKEGRAVGGSGQKKPRQPSSCPVWVSACQKRTYVL
ncbi:hypothetical protein HMPREF0083_03285 [Aneurinibacillus aneurinilyticus ATCC 12856]|uniref:Uncharacterized protein n=1 Tax=Aneurinibacillus aneurinilyticus ATCC 12856 TaxID=649747 RepID=U1Y8R4_ANEAE|nr:hypothetical protein HMPREF0083_03285 [Aneurinibacillus aneurinilyticus ATCC 12856]